MVSNWKSGDYQKNREYHLSRKNLWYAEVKERLGAAYLSDCRRKWRMDNPEKYVLANARKNAKDSKREFNISLEDIKIPEVCPILGISIKLYADRDNAPSIDRVDNSLGYIKGNVQVISWRANNLKSNGTLGEFQKLVNWMESIGT